MLFISLSDLHGEDIEDFEGTTPDSYNKLIAWMLEMSENDEMALNSDGFVEHLAKICAQKHQRQNTISSESRQHSLDSNTQVSISKPRLKYSEHQGIPFRQHSYDAATYHSVSPLTQSSLDSQNGLLSVSTQLRQHSSDSSCSSRSRNSKTSRGNSHSREDILDPRTRFRRAMLSRQGTIDVSDGEIADINETSMDISGSSSFEHDSDTDIIDPTSVLLNKNCQETSFVKHVKIPTKSDKDINYHGISSSVGDLLHNRTNFGDAARPKSKSLTTMRRIKSETRNADDITPITEAEEEYPILEDSLLDGNIADILYSVEALWPKRGDSLSQECY